MANINIPPPLRKYTAGRAAVQVDASTVRELLDALEDAHPGIKERICDDKGAIRRFVNVFVADEDIRFLEELDTRVGGADEVSIVPAIAGG